MTDKTDKTNTTDENLFNKSMKQYKKIAIDLAYESGEIMRNNFSLGMKKEWKGDNTPLTETDTRINKLVIDTISKHFPDHSILGEEGSKMIESSEYTWVCDPIDGTIPFSHGYPTFVFSLALTKNGESILGVIYDPMLDRLLVAEKGKGATMNNKPISVSKISSFATAQINLDAKLELTRLREIFPKESRISTLLSAVYSGLLVACGEFVAEIFEHKHPWDGAAVKIIVEEAGGKVTDIFGNEQRYDREINGFVASNGIMHDKIIALIKSIKQN